MNIVTDLTTGQKLDEMKSVMEIFAVCKRIKKIAGPS
jgi:hypothetical protein